MCTAYSAARKTKSRLQVQLYLSLIAFDLRSTADCINGSPPSHLNILQSTLPALPSRATAVADPYILVVLRSRSNSNMLGRGPTRTPRSPSFLPLLSLLPALSSSQHSIAPAVVVDVSCTARSRTGAIAGPPPPPCPLLLAPPAPLPPSLGVRQRAGECRRRSSDDTQWCVLCSE